MKWKRKPYRRLVQDQKEIARGFGSDWRDV